MNKYWKDHFDSNALKFPDSPLKQVEATVHGREIDRSQLDLIVRSIADNLSLSRSDYVADLCCGNGLITKFTAALSKQVYGVDFSENLISNARSINAAPNIEYIVSNVAMLGEDFFSRPSKIYMCTALQHLDTEVLVKLLNQVSQSPQWDSFFISAIPDVERLNAFYDNDEKLAFYRKRDAVGQPHIGRWWSQTELTSLVANAGLKIRFIPQYPSLFTSHYRFDCLIERA